MLGDLHPVTKLILPNLYKIRESNSQYLSLGRGFPPAPPDRPRVSAVSPRSVFAARQDGEGAVPGWGRILAGLTQLRLPQGGFQKTGKVEHCQRLRTGVGQWITVIFDLWITTCFLPCASTTYLFLMMGHFFSFTKSIDYRMKNLGSNKTLPPFAFLPSFHSCCCFSPCSAWRSPLCISFPAAASTSQLILSSCH